MAFDYSKLRGKIVEKFGTQTEFSKAMNLSERTMSLKLNGGTGLDLQSGRITRTFKRRYPGLFFYSKSSKHLTL